ncbi:glucanosyltransferase domain-containing protein [Hirsutella rhossiliensis]|uniref:1,3-beta-glucanosyltransferase n=1 Tax=Hirsutella rhossiliensis TaxID=111463 RepID=A0A9P8SEV7_9HYPO|nr:glucanosyltransferase domain-containing protein [Hirsutella rhossiliensis]KAH0959434.1 glucanosyltransferase domain-containing protein [Hirsutella rhossiliensis]
MKQFALVSALAALGTVSASPTATEKEPPSKRANLPTVTVSGNAFWADKERFYIRGIDYQPGGSSADTDPLADKATCTRDIAKFKELGVNTIRVYAVDNSAKHDDCMKALEDAGIYLVLDVNTPKYSINRSKPGPSYNTNYLQSIFATVEMFAQYPNTLAFFSGNEVINDQKDTDLSAPYVKAVTRDMKNYMNSRGLRRVPVGYSAADVASNRLQTANYMNCGTDDMRSDFFAFNDYSWCNSDFKTSGWDQKVKTFSTYGLPIFLSEWGCIKNRPRKFEEIAAMMSSEMTSVYSGGLMYEYSVEGNDFGIVKISGNTVDTDAENGEFKLFASALKDNPAPTGAGGAATTTHSVSCPTKGSDWNVDPSLVPSMPQQAEKFMKNGAGGGPGLAGSGSQDASDSGTATASVTGGKASPTGGGSGGKSDDDSAAMSVHAGMDKAPVVVCGLTLFFTLFGAALL